MDIQMGKIWGSKGDIAEVMRWPSMVVCDKGKDMIKRFKDDQRRSM